MERVNENPCQAISRSNHCGRRHLGGNRRLRRGRVRCHQRPGRVASVPDTYPGGGTGSSAPPVPVNPDAAAGCTPFAQGDNVHPSSGDASGHGWWTIGDGGCPNEKAKVTVGLQEYFSDKTWHNEGSVGTASVYPGGGSANRAVARATCASTVPAGWRSYVIVAIGNGASGYTPAQNIACRT